MAQWEEARSLWLSIRERWRHSTIIDEDMSGSGSGMLGYHDNSVEPVIISDRVETWREEQSDWTNELESWRVLVQEKDEVESEGAGPEIDPNDLWTGQLTSWATEYFVYNSTFYNICLP